MYPAAVDRSRRHQSARRLPAQGDRVRHDTQIEEVAEGCVDADLKKRLKATVKDPVA